MFVLLNQNILYLIHITHEISSCVLSIFILVFIWPFRKLVKQNVSHYFPAVNNINGPSVAIENVYTDSTER
jgi:hypothetical protein